MFRKMSSSSYCQGLQSCLDPGRLVEPRVLRLKLAPSKSNNTSVTSKPLITDSDCDTKSNKIADTAGWSFLQALASHANSQTATKETTNENQKLYVPPNFKRSSSMLSEKSLEMCTESLGSETGSRDVRDCSDEMGLLSLGNNVNYETSERPKSYQTRRTMNPKTNFPPPLNSISGSTSVRVMPHREGGRLVLEAVSVSSCHSYLRAESTDGRLRLHFVDSFPYSCCLDEEQEAEAEYDDEKVVDEEDGFDEDQSEEESEGGEDDIWGEELEANVGGEMGMGNLERQGRCKEGANGDQGLLTWEPILVAT